MNCLIITDRNWDNIPLIKKYISYLNENFRVHAFYNIMIQCISRYCFNYGIDIIRHCLSKNFYEDLKKRISYSDFCFIFTDFIEYNTLSRVTIDICDISNVPYFIFSNNNSNFLYNGEYGNQKFKKYIKNLHKIQKPIKLIDVEKENLQLNNDKKIIDYDSIRRKLKDNYDFLKYKKQTRSIIII